MDGELRYQAILTPDGIERNRALRVEGGVIRRISEASGPWDGWVALPGLPNAHSHVFQRALAGFGEKAAGNDTFWSWREAMYTLAGRLTPSALYAIARFTYGEMLLAGYTSVVEFHYTHRGRGGATPREMAGAVSEAARDVGLPIHLLPVYYRTSDFGTPALPEQEPFVHSSVEAFFETVDDLPDVRGVAPHSLRAVPARDLGTLVELTDRTVGRDAPLHIHLAEQAREVDSCVEASGTTPLRLLDDHVELGPRWSLIHATRTDAEEREVIRSRGANLVICPITEAYLGDGIFPAEEYVGAGGRLAVGSDANTRLDAAEELRLLEYGQRLANRRRARLGDGTGLGSLWNAAASAGAAATGCYASAGALRVGCRADLIVLDPDSPGLAGHDPVTAVDAWIVAGGRDLASVRVAGEERVRAGALSGHVEARRDFARVLQGLCGV